MSHFKALMVTVAKYFVRNRGFVWQQVILYIYIMHKCMYIGMCVAYRWSGSTKSCTHIQSHWSNEVSRHSMFLCSDFMLFLGYFPYLLPAKWQTYIIKICTFNVIFTLLTIGVFVMVPRLVVICWGYPPSLEARFVENIYTP